MTCKERIAALVECARRGESPEGELREHLACCESCLTRWRAERDLAVHLGAMTAVAQAREGSSRMRRDARAAALMVNFEAARPRLQLVKPAQKLGWGAGLAMAAALLLAVGVGYQTGAKERHGLRPSGARPPAVRTNGVNGSGRSIYEASADADALSGGDFIAVPFALPLAPGEIVSVVHSELYPEALASMGIDVDPAVAGNETGGVPADVVMGQDGFPRAVRISEATDF